MSSDLHEKLVTVIRRTAENMREDYLKSGGNYEKVWQDHVIANDVREQYAQSMFSLATKVWPQSDSRIHWCYNIIKDFFYGDGLKRSLKRELCCLLRQQKITNTETVQNMYLGKSSQYLGEKIRLLDVGSCYNPFGEFTDLDIVSIDLTPATKDVYSCDFLQLEIVPSSVPLKDLKEPPGTLCQLRAESFHVVVFSLFLSYLPAAEQRFISCQKALKLLKENGLLLMITPDSKSQHYNARMIKSWKAALEYLGFVRVVYEKKQHLHCMAYRKTPFSTFHTNGTEYVDVVKMIYIPQDFKKIQDIPSPVARTEDDDENIKNIFLELPLCDDLE